MSAKSWIAACVVGIAACAGTQNAGGDAGGADATGGDSATKGDALAPAVDPNWAAWPMPNGAVDSPPAPNLESYTDNQDGTVTDNITGLMWQQTISNAPFTWGDASTAGTAQNYCKSLSLAGHNDWRLPALIELVSIVDLSAQDPTINATYFPNTPAQQFWSATPVAGSQGNAWYVFFVQGITANYPVTSGANVRCVRS